MTSRDKEICTVVGCKNIRRGEELTCHIHYLMVLEANEREDLLKAGRRQPTVYSDMFMGGFVGILPFTYCAVDPSKKPSSDEVYEHYGHLVAHLTPEEMEKIESMERGDDEWIALAKAHDFDPEKARIREDGVVLVP